MSETERTIQTKRWLAYAHEDLNTAQSIRLEGYAVPRQICFLSQQALEKALKAVLVYCGIDPPRTHDLNRLHSLIPADYEIDCDIRRLAQLTEWAVESRYPGDWPEATDEDSRQATESAKEIFGRIEAVLALRGL